MPARGLGDQTDRRFNMHRHLYTEVFIGIEARTQDTQATIIASYGAKKENRDSNTIVGRRTFYLNGVLQHVFEITTESRLVGLTAALLGIPYVLEVSSILPAATDIRAMSTTADCCAHYHPHLHRLSACQPIPRFNTSSFSYLGKRIANDDFQQGQCSRNLPFSTIYPKTSLRNLPERQEFYAASLSDLPDGYWSNFRTLLEVHPFNRMLSVPLMCCCFCCFPFFFAPSSQLRHLRPCIPMGNSKLSVYPLHTLQVGRSSSESPV
ncbi:hypothetical protein TNCV_2322461 [Trichonephila clavipes]|nr:hypothetical protein TNCV_2322461 [Trichonephila clavipes]